MHGEQQLLSNLFPFPGASLAFEDCRGDVSHTSALSPPTFQRPCGLVAPRPTQHVISSFSRLNKRGKGKASRQLFRPTASGPGNPGISRSQQEDPPLGSPHMALICPLLPGVTRRNFTRKNSSRCGFHAISLLLSEFSPTPGARRRCQHELCQNIRTPSMLRKIF